jgi:hypothetical protein
VLLDGKGRQVAAAAAVALLGACAVVSAVFVLSVWHSLHRPLGSDAQAARVALGVSIYPGATARMERIAEFRDANSVEAIEEYTTGDPPSAVLDFYRARLRGRVRESMTGLGTTLDSMRVNGDATDDILVFVGPDSQVDSGFTKIAIAHRHWTRPGQWSGPLRLCRKIGR